jgi:hypothetical protein
MRKVKFEAVGPPILTVAEKLRRRRIPCAGTKSDIRHDN